MLESCPGCGALFPPIDAPTHRYIGGSAGCWALYSPIVAGEVPLPELLAASCVSGSPRPPVHSAPPALGALLVDAYAAQHHGDDSPQAVQSVAVHLLALHGVLRRGLRVEQALWARRRALRRRGVFHRLTPPPLGAALTIRHIFPGGGVAQPCARPEYVASVYESWAAMHEDTLAGWYEHFVLAD